MKKVKDELGNRMKEYERVSEKYLTRRMPVCVRLDGVSFHSYTRGLKRPFDRILVKAMQETMKYLCKNIPGCVLGFTQSDEISLIIVDYQRLKTKSWFDNKQNKLESVIASMCTMAFNKAFEKIVNEFTDSVTALQDWDAEEKYLHVLAKAIDKGAYFDCRAFNVPKEDVTNYIYWRQFDCMKNSVSMVGQDNFSHKELQHKNRNDIKEMLLAKGIDWNELPLHLQRGSCCIKENYFVPDENGKNIKFPDGCSDPYTDDEIEKGVWRSRWIIDDNIPIFRNEGREYIEKLINVGE